MPPLVNASMVRIFADKVRNLAMAAAKEVAKEVARATNKEVATEFIEELAKEIAQKIIKELLKRSTKEPDTEDQVVGTKVQGEEDMYENEIIWVEGLKVQEEEDIMDIDEIISKILYDHRAYEPPVEEVKDQLDGPTELTLPDAREGMDETELLPSWPLQDDRARKLLKEFESLEKEWIALTVAQATETTPESKWSWKGIIIASVVVIILVGGAYLWYRWCSGSGSGGGNGGGGAGEDGRGAMALGPQEQEQEQGFGSDGRGAVALAPQEQEQGFGSDGRGPPKNQAAADQVAHPPGPVGLQILLCGSDLPSGPLAWRRIVSIDGLVSAARGTRDVAAAHPAPLALPAGTAIISEALEETIEAAIGEEFTKLLKDLKSLPAGIQEEVKEASRGAYLQKDLKSEVSSVVSCLEDGFQELIISLLSQSQEEKIIVEEEALKPCKSEHVPLVAGPVGTALCV